MSETEASETPTCSMDSSCFIEWLADEGRHHPKEVVDAIHDIITETATGARVMVVSAFTLVEVRKLSEAGGEKFRRIVQGDNLRVYPLGAPLAFAAVELGDRLNLGNGDAVLLATAIAVGARAFYTLDRGLLRLDLAGVYLRGDGGKVMRPPDGFRIVEPGRESRPSPAA